jgi:hypothetical protein
MSVSLMAVPPAVVRGFLALGDDVQRLVERRVRHDR